MTDRLLRRCGVPVAFLLAAVTLAALDGCNYAYWQRQHSKPADYDEAPLGPAYDSPDEIKRLTDEELRGWMMQWLDARREHLALWKEYGDEDPRTRRVWHYMSTLRAVIQVRRDQLWSMGVPLEQPAGG